MYIGSVKKEFLELCPELKAEGMRNYRESEKAVIELVEASERARKKVASNVSELPTSPTESNEPQGEEKGAYLFCV